MRNIHSRGHTRLPRYVRGKSGTIVRYHGVHDFPDHERTDEPESQPQPIYNVRFDMAELWGDSAEAREQLFIDLFESYLEPSKG